jgi:hypothetical protein
MLRRICIRQIIRPLLERLPHLLHVPIPIVNRGHAPIGVAEHSLDELVAGVPKAFRQARRYRPTQIVGAEFLCELLSGDRENRIGKTGPEILRHALDRRASGCGRIAPKPLVYLVQSAYVLEPGKPVPGKGRIHLHALLGHALRGTIPDRLHEPAPAHPQKRETPPEAGFRQSGSTYLPPGRTFWKAGVHRAGFCAQGKLRTLALDYQVVSMWGHTSRQCNL